MMTELFGDECRLWTLEQVKEKINALPRVQAERYSYLLHDWAVITGNELTEQDFKDVGGIEQET